MFQIGKRFVPALFALVCIASVAGYAFAQHSASDAYAAPAIKAKASSPPLSVYVGSWDHHEYALNCSDGSVRCSYFTGLLVTSTATVVHGIVYFGSDDHRVYALHSSDGSLLWKHDVLGAAVGSPTVVNGVIYEASSGGFVFALNAN